MRAHWLSGDQGFFLSVSRPPKHDVILRFLVGQSDGRNDVSAKVNPEDADRSKRKRNLQENKYQERKRLISDVSNGVSYGLF